MKLFAALLATVAAASTPKTAVGSQCDLKSWTGTDTELAAEGATLFDAADVTQTIDLMTVADASTQELRFSPGNKVCVKWAFDMAKLNLNANTQALHS